MDCVFCDVLSGGRPGFFVHRAGGAAAILDRYPIDEGHCLVMPEEHRERITDMAPGEVGRLFGLVPAIARAAMAATGADSFSIAQNNGRAARQIIPHVHVHVIPRKSGRGAVWTRRTIASDEELARLAGDMRARLDGATPSGPGCT